MSEHGMRTLTSLFVWDVCAVLCAGQFRIFDVDVASTIHRHVRTIVL